MTLPETSVSVLGVDEIPPPTTAAPGADERLIAYLRTWADKCEEYRVPGKTPLPGYDYGIEALRLVAKRLEELTQ